MKVLWVEDHPRAGELLAAADAKRKLGVGLFALVIAALSLPDSADEDVTVPRLANMGKFRVAVVSASERRQDGVDSLLSAGVDCAPRAVGKEDLPLGEFVKRPEVFRDFVSGLMASTDDRSAATG